MFTTLLKLMTLRPKLSILIYHQVLPEYDFMRPSEMTADTFRVHLSHLKKHFNVFTLQDALQRLQAGNLPSNAAVITFDDGYEDNASVALPLLQEFALPATFFIASDFLNGGAMWNDRVLETVKHWPDDKLVLPLDNSKVFDTSTEQARMQTGRALLLEYKYLPLDERAEAVAEFAAMVPQTMQLMMSDEQVVQLHQAGMEIGGHTCSHPILSTLTDDEAFKQIADNKQYLERILGTEIQSFAYPNGKPEQDYNAASVEQVKKAGYKYAVSTSYGVSNANTDMYQVPRFTPWHDDEFGFMRLMLQNFFNKPQTV